MSPSIVVHEIAVLLLVAAAGAGARRFGWLDDAVVARLSRLVIDVAMPAMLFTQLLDTTDAAALRAGWMVPLLGIAVLLVGWGVGKALAVPIGGSSTFVFLAGLPNWVYLPLPIAKAAFGDAGVRDVLLVNLGCMPILWTVGVVVLRGAAGDAWKGAFTPGLVASAAAIALALAHPAVPGGPVVAEALSASYAALSIVGSLAIPLSLLLTGAQIAAAAPALPGKALLGVIVARLLVVPLVVVALIAGLAWAGVGIGHDRLLLLCLIAAMPVAISAGPFAERFGGDVQLASQAVLWTTPLSLATVPIVLAVAARFGV
jgi:predicted permease